MPKYCSCCGEKMDISYKLGFSEVCYSCNKNYFNIQSFDDFKTRLPFFNLMYAQTCDITFKEDILDLLTLMKEKYSTELDEESNKPKTKEEEEKEYEKRNKRNNTLKNKKNWTKQYILEHAWDVEKGCVYSLNFSINFTCSNSFDESKKMNDLINLYITCGWKIISVVSTSIASNTIFYTYVLQSPKLSELE